MNLISAFIYLTGSICISLAVAMHSNMPSDGLGVFGAFLVLLAAVEAAVSN